MYTGDRISAQEMYRRGIVEKIVPPEKLWEEAMAMAATVGSVIFVVVVVGGMGSLSGAFLASVLIGSEVAGISGAIFGIPVAAVISAMATHYFRIWGEAEAAAAKAEASPVRRPGKFR